MFVLSVRNYLWKAYLNLSIDFLKYLGNIAKKTSSFLSEIFLASMILISRRDLTLSLAEILGDVLATLTLRSRQDLTWNLVEILGKFLAAEILRSCQDLGGNLDETLRSRQESRWVFGRRDFKISPWSRRESRRESRRIFGRRDLGEISAILPAKNSPRFLPRSRSKFCWGQAQIIINGSERIGNYDLYHIITCGHLQPRGSRASNTSRTTSAPSTTWYEQRNNITSTIIFHYDLNSN